jgi:hypothetical protein
MNSSTTTLVRGALAATLALGLSGCAVVGIAVTGAGLAVDAAVGVVKVTGAVAGAAVDVVLPSSDDKKK